MTRSTSQSYELVIFDCDGVLVDSEPIANRLFAEMLTGEGLALTTSEAMRRYMGRSFASCREMIESELGRALPAGFFAELCERTLRAFRHELRRVEGVGDVLDQISTPICVASSSTHERLRLSLEVTDLLSRFEGRIFSAYDVPRGKPAPDLFLHAARRMGAAPERCAVVEDSAPGVEAGMSAGMRVYGYAWHGDARALRAAGARVFHRMPELSTLLVSQLAHPAQRGEKGPLERNAAGRPQAYRYPLRGYGSSGPAIPRAKACATRRRSPPRKLCACRPLLRMSSARCALFRPNSQYTR